MQAPLEPTRRSAQYSERVARARCANAQPGGGGPAQVAHLGAAGPPPGLSAKPFGASGCAVLAEAGAVPLHPARDCAVLSSSGVGFWMRTS